MNRPKRLQLWALVLLAATVCWSAASAFAQSPRANPRATQKPQRPPNALSNRQKAKEELSAAVAERAQNDPLFRAYLDALAKHNQQVEEFVRAKKAGVR